MRLINKRNENTNNFEQLYNRDGIYIHVMKRLNISREMTFIFIYAKNEEKRFCFFFLRVYKYYINSPTLYVETKTNGYFRFLLEQ